MANQYRRCLADPHRDPRASAGRSRHPAIADAPDGAGPRGPLVQVLRARPGDRRRQARSRV